MHRPHSGAGESTSKPTSVGGESERGQAVSYYEADPWANHALNEIVCGECEREYDEQEGEGNICPTCKEKEGESND